MPESCNIYLLGDTFVARYEDEWRFGASVCERLRENTNDMLNVIYVYISPTFLQVS